MLVSIVAIAFVRPLVCHVAAAASPGCPEAGSSDLLDASTWLATTNADWNARPELSTVRPVVATRTRSPSFITHVAALVNEVPAFAAPDGATYVAVIVATPSPPVAVATPLFASMVAGPVALNVSPGTGVSHGWRNATPSSQ